jgi:hypothetical protein
MLARRLTTALPDMTPAEAIDTISVHSVAGLTGGPTAFYPALLCRHHTIWAGGVISRRQVPSPGDVSLAHHGILFLDERPGFRRYVLEVSRQPLDDRRVTIARVPGLLRLQSVWPTCPPPNVKRSLFRTTPAPHLRSFADRLRRQIKGETVSLHAVVAEGGG